jgi:hypothetical protein
MLRFRIESRVSLDFRHRRIDAGVAVEGAVAARFRPSRGLNHARDLATELEQYTTPAELLDLQAVLQRHDDEDTDEIRSILARQALNRARKSSERWPLR